MDNNNGAAVPTTNDSVTGPQADYEPPTFTRLGTLSELTLGEGGGFDDAVGGYNGDGPGSI